MSMTRVAVVQDCPVLFDAVGRRRDAVISSDTSKALLRYRARVPRRSDNMRETLVSTL
jgi:hypothetical protein